jgi:DNA-binding HxlR family transcriptional regulator
MIRILWEVRGDARRYVELQRALSAAMGGRAITPRVLSRELRQLVEAGLVTWKQYPVIPPRVEYRATAEGRALLPVMRWGGGEPAAARPRGARGRTA